MGFKKKKKSQTLTKAWIDSKNPLNSDLLLYLCNWKDEPHINCIGYRTNYNFYRVFLAFLSLVETP